MKSTWWGVFLFWAGMFACLASTMGEDGTFQVIPGQASLDGHFTIGYGVNDLTKTPLQDLQEVPEDDAEFERRFRTALQAAEEAEPVNLKNYLVDLRTHHAVAVLPGFRYFPRKNHYELEVGWAVDGTVALAIYRTRFCNGAVAWIDTRKGRVTAMGDKLEKDFRGLLVQDKGKAYTRRRKEYAISFLDPIVIRSGDVIVGWAVAGIPKQEDEFDYALRFHLTEDHGRPKFVLVHARRGGDDEYDQPLDNPQEEMEAAYRRLRSRLCGAERKSLEREQAEWTRLADKDRGYATDWRARELELRLDLR